MQRIFILKIAKRMDTMNKNGSNLLVESTDEINIHISVTNLAKSDQSIPTSSVPFRKVITLVIYQIW